MFHTVLYDYSLNTLGISLPWHTPCSFGLRRKCGNRKQIIVADVPTVAGSRVPTVPQGHCFCWQMDCSKDITRTKSGFCFSTIAAHPSHNFVPGKQHHLKGRVVFYSPSSSLPLHSHYWHRTTRRKHV